MTRFYRFSPLLSVLGFSALVFGGSGCNSGSNKNSDAFGTADTPGGTTDVPVVTDGTDASDGSDGTAAGDGQSDVVGSDIVAADTVESPDDVDPGDVATEEDVFVPQPGAICGTKIDGGLPLGAPCTQHEECGTGYCYDEELFNEDGQILNRFCTAKCAGCTTVGSCNEWPKAVGVEENKCTPLTSAFINKNKLALTSVCLVGCLNDGDCTALGQFSKCRLLQFDGSCSYGVVKVCQPEEFAGNEECN